MDLRGLVVEELVADDVLFAEVAVLELVRFVEDRVALAEDMVSESEAGIGCSADEEAVLKRGGARRGAY